MIGRPTRIISKNDEKGMILIPDASFQMGSDEGPEKHRPQHMVDLPAFYIDCFPVTNREYKRHVDETGRPVPCFVVTRNGATGTVLRR